MSGHDRISDFSEMLAEMKLPERLSAMVDFTSRKAVFTTSLGREDQLLLWAICSNKLPVGLVTLHTGLLFPETEALLEQTRTTYGVDIEEVRPSADSVAGYVEEYGQRGFYDSIEARKACCAVRKTEPLKQALEGAGSWITGLTREQSQGRSTVPFAQWDSQYELIKFNPLADKSASWIDEQIQEHDIPVNALHDRGYPSIGCEPCTRAIKPG